MSVTHDSNLDQGQEVGILIALLDEEISVGDDLAEGILRSIEDADKDFWDVSWMDIPEATHVSGSDGRPLITEEVFLKVTLLGNFVSWKMEMPIPDSMLWLHGVFDRRCLGSGGPHLFLKGEIKEVLRSAAGDLLSNRLG